MKTIGRGPRVTLNSERRTMSDIPKAKNDCFWHSRQWHS